MQSFGPDVLRNVTSLPLAVHIPAIVGQPAPDNVKVPAGSKRSVKSRTASGPDGNVCAAATSSASTSANSGIAASYRSVTFLLDAGQVQGASWAVWWRGAARRQGVLMDIDRRKFIA